MSAYLGMSSVNWIPIWRGLALDLLREGYCSRKAVETWARKNNWHLRTVTNVIEALAVEPFEHEGEVYFHLTGKVVPLLPRDVRDVSMYRNAAASVGGAAARALKTVVQNPSH
jgi:hypothetical protein